MEVDYLDINGYGCKLNDNTLIDGMVEFFKPVQIIHLIWQCCRLKLHHHKVLLLVQ